ncbi:MAG: PIG-L family deacetylase, partial [Firmicutes bacterium]|nr:PIG-L family deacetylase [Bacillota bacterium]
MSLTRFILRFAAPVPQVESFEKYLFIGPHPDDIEIGAGATAAKLAAAGKKITFLVCTD